MTHEMERGVPRFIPNEAHKLYEEYVIAARAYFILPTAHNWEQKETTFEKYHETMGKANTQSLRHGEGV